MFWTMETRFGIPETTLCEECVLSATNEAQGIIGDPPFGSMTEAYIILTTQAAIAGFDYGLTSNEVGPCEQCEWDAAHKATDTQESA